MRVVICGATSHIARAIAPFFSEHELILFARDPQGLQGENVSVESDFSRLAATPCDADKTDAEIEYYRNLRKSQPRGVRTMISAPRALAAYSAI